MHSQFKYFATVAVAAIVAVDAGATEPGATFEVLKDPAVMEAIRTVWHYALHGRIGMEASFRLDGDPSGYKLLVTPFTNQFRKQTVAIVAGVTFAVFHVHTANSDPAPSKADRAIADRYNLKIYTIHLQGLYEYDPVTKKTAKLRSGVSWIDGPP